MLSVSEIVAKTEAMFDLFNHHFYNDELTRPAITVSPDGGRIRYNKLRKFRNRRIENSPQNKGQGQRHLVE